MQLMASVGVEFGEHKGLGLDQGQGGGARSRPTGACAFRRWAGTTWTSSAITRCWPTPRAGDHAYFVHSYHFVAERPTDVIATVDYGGPVAAVIGRDNLLGVQFHPEKSQHVGLALLKSFLKWIP